MSPSAGGRPSPRDVFHLGGRLVTAEGAPLAGVALAIVDRDPFRDDLLGVGRTGADGSFRISFCRSEFNQDFLEREALPDVEIVLSARIDGKEQAFWRRSFPELAFRYGHEELGAVVVESWRKRLDPLVGVEPRPGGTKRVRRLRLDEALIWDCLEEVAPQVSRLTGWENLLGGVQLRISPLAALGPEDSLEQAGVHWLMQRACGYVAAYVPRTHTIFVDRARMERLNLDAMKVVLGHELVHVGQLRAHPELAPPESGGTSGEAPGDEAPWTWARSWIEGYAYYVQDDFLRSHYNLATFFRHEALIDGVVGETQPLWWPPDVEGVTLADMFRKIRRAMRHYRSLQTGELPPRFKVPRQPGQRRRA